MENGVISQIASSLSDAAGVPKREAASSIIPRNGKFGDLSTTIAFALAKKKNANPAELAQKICGRLALPECVSEAKAAGPYINFFLSDAQWAKFIHEFSSVDFGKGSKKRGKTLIEFPSVNPNKPWHIGHLRNALLGDSLARIIEYAGNEVEREDYIDDLGLQVAQSVWGAENLPKMPEGKFDHALGMQYVQAAKRLSEPAVEGEVRAIIHELEAGTSLRTKAARATVEKCVAAQYETAFAYGICHDVLIFESDIVRTIFSEGIGKLKSSGALKLETEGKNAGCYVVPLGGAAGFEGMESPDKILIRSDGTATYTGKDAVFQLWKFGKLEGKFNFVPFLRQPNGKAAYMSATVGRPEKFGCATRVINVICQDQSYPQKVLKVVLERLGFAAEAENSIHLAYELVSRKEGKFSGREGTWMGEGGQIGFTADELLEEGARRAMEKIKGEFSDEGKKAIARNVALGAIRFSFLRQSSDKKIVFDWDSALSFEGDSGPYIMYANARAGRILEKAGGQTAGGAIDAQTPSSAYKFSPEEKALLSHIMQLPSLVERCCTSCQAHPMAEFTLELAGRFSRFYATTPVLAGDVGEIERAVRLSEVNCAKNALGISMSLLGIPAIEKM